MKAWQVVGVVAGMAGSAAAFWRMECHHQTGYGRMDPIVDYGEISGHVHSFTGSNGKSATCALTESEFTHLLTRHRYDLRCRLRQPHGRGHLHRV